MVWTIDVKVQIIDRVNEQNFITHVQKYSVCLC